jgi:UDP-glucose 4-epimerase
MKTLITGGAGFIGSHLADLLLDNGHDVIIIDNLVNGSMENIPNNDRVKFYNVDIRYPEQLDGIFDGVDWVFHLAGMADIVPSIENPEIYHQCNAMGTFNVLEVSRRANIKRFVYAASSSSYGIPKQYPTSELSEIQPQYPYALTKHMGEELVLHWAQVYKLPAISLRLFNVYGPRSRTTGAYGAVFGVFLSQKIHSKPFTVVGDGKQTRDFTYVTDVANAFFSAASSNVSNIALNVGSGNHYSVNYLVKLLDGDVVYIPKRPGEPDCTFADTKLIRNMLGWVPKVSFEDGVQKILSSIDDWSDAPVWDTKSIEDATSSWFKYLG